MFRSACSNSHRARSTRSPLGVSPRPTSKRRVATFPPPQRGPAPPHLFGGRSWWSRFFSQQGASLKPAGRLLSLGTALATPFLAVRGQLHLNLQRKASRP